jgi:hypothetical protein
MNLGQSVTSKDGTTIAFETTGTGPPIILVASALSDRSDAKRLAASPGTTLHSYQLRQARPGSERRHGSVFGRTGG